MDKVNNVIDIIKDMTFINKLRFGVCVFSSGYLNFKYDKKGQRSPESDLSVFLLSYLSHAALSTSVS